MPSLDEILSIKREEVAALKARQRRAGSTTVMQGVGKIRSTRQALADAGAMAIVPELKKADPWRGVLHEQFQAITYAKELERAGAPVLAIQTDSQFFHGSVDELHRIARRVEVPVIQREFIVDEAQITEGKAKGADAVILIAGLLEPAALKAFVQFADYIWLETIVEVAKPEEIDAALAAGAKAIGVQNRDLHSQTLQIERTIALRKSIPDDVTTLVVGGLSEPDDVQRFRDEGFDAAVIGDWLMRAPSVTEAFRELAATGSAPVGSVASGRRERRDSAASADSDDTRPSIG